MASFPLTPPSTVYRIQRRHAVDRSPANIEHCASDRFAANVMGHSLTPFTLPTTHIWSLTLADCDFPHIVLFHDAKNAHAMVRALRSFARKEMCMPQHYNDMRRVFQSHYMPSFWASDDGDMEDLHVAECDFKEISDWASMRRIGVLAIATIGTSNNEPEGSFQVPITTITPNEDQQDVDAEIAFNEDFEWQMRDLFD